MRKLFVLFTILAITFAGLWIYKIRTPGERPENYVSDMDGNFWWNSIVEAEEVDTSWRLSEGVPKNYIPVPGKADLYMVVDEDGYIVSYKKMSKNAETNEITWEDVNPDIPENYEAVPNLKDVYKVTYDDGSVKYFKYVRNKDDTYAFVEVDAKGNVFGMEQPNGNEIPDNYERVNKNQYAVKNNNGVVIGYKERVVDPQNPGGFVWEDVETEDISISDAPSIASSGFNLDTDITGIGDDTGGNRPYYEKPSEGDASFEIIAMPTLMPQQSVSASSSNNGTFVFTNPTQQTIITEQVYVTAPPFSNTGGQISSSSSLSPSQSVIVNMPTQADGNNSFITDIQGNVISGDMSSQVSGAQSSSYSSEMPTMAPFVDNYIADGNGGNAVAPQPGVVYDITQEKVGNYVSRENVITKVQEGNDMVTYQETIEKILDANGQVIQSGSIGKQEIGRVPIAGGGEQGVASTLNDEYDRITKVLFGNGGSFDANTPARVRELINNARMEAGKQPLLAPGSNDAIYKVALSRAAMMAATGSGSKDLPGYGSLNNMCAKYGVSIGTVSESMLATGVVGAEAINASLTTVDLINADNYTHVSIAIAIQNGRMYVCEIFY